MKRIFHAHLSKPLALLLGWLLLCSLPSSSLAATSSEQSPPLAVEVSDDNLLVVQMTYDNLLLEESVFVFHTPEYTLIPIQILIDALDFPLAIDLDALTIDGWFIDEANSFALDITQREVYLKGSKKEWPANFLYAMDGFDVYFNLDTIKQWFNLDLHLNVSQLSLKVESERTLPMIEQRLREEKRKKLKPTEDNTAQPPLLPNTYDWLGAPILDVEFSYDGQRYQQTDADSGITTEETAHSTSASVQGVMDALKHSLSISYTKQEGSSDLRLTMRKSAEKPGEHIWPGIDSYALGDLSSHSDNLVYNATTGMGVYAAKGSTQIQEQASALLIEGDAPPGWEVELYRNGSLIDFKQAENNGKFSFDGIQTFIGENIFDVRIYGPQGQYREQQKRIQISSKMLTPGDWSYQTYVLEKGQSLIDGSTEKNDETSQFMLVDGYWGINDKLTGGLSVSQLEVDGSEEEKTYLSLSTFSSFLGGLLQTQLAANDESGSAYALAYKSRWQSLNYNLEYKKFNHLISDHNANNTLSSDTQLTLNGIAQDLLPVTLSYDFTLSSLHYRTHQSQWQIDNRLSSRIAQTQIAHSLKYTHSDLNEQTSTLEGSLALTRRFNYWRAKLETSYTIDPETDLASLQASASYRAKDHLSYMANVAFVNSNDKQISFDNTFSWSFRPLAVSLSFGLDNQKNRYLGIGFNTSLGYDRSNKTLSLDSESSSNNATALVRAYIDENNNGQFDTHEEPLEGVKFQGRNSWKERPSNDAGLSSLNGIPNLSMQSISVDERSVEDPFLRARSPLINLYTHAGKQNYFEFAFVPTLEIEGEIKVKSKGGMRPVSGLTLTLKDQDNKVITTVSEYDGVYLFNEVLPGNYQLFVNTQGKRESYEEITPLNIQVKGDEGVVYAPTITLTPIQ